MLQTSLLCMHENRVTALLQTCLCEHGTACQPWQVQNLFQEYRNILEVPEEPDAERTSART